MLRHLQPALRWSLCLLWLLIGPSWVWAQDWNIRRTDRWQKIERRLFALYTKNPQEGYALRRLLIHYRRKGGPKALLRRLYQRQQKQPKRWRLRLAEALIYLQIGRSEKALVLLEGLRKKLGTQKGAPDLRWPLARAYFRQQKWTKARKLYASVYRSSKSRSRTRKVLKALIQLDSQKGAWDQAIQWYKKLLKLQPRDVDLRINLARMYARLGKWPKAISTLRQAIPMTPVRRRPALWTKIVRFHLENKEYPQALKALSKARARLLRTHWLQNVLTELEIDAHRGQKTLPKLIKAYKQKAKRKPKEYLPLVARIHTELKQIDEALKAYEQLLEKHPKHPALKSAISLMLEHGRPKQALTWLRRKIKRVPDDQDAPIRLLTILHQQENTKARNKEAALLLKKKQPHAFLEKLERLMLNWQEAARPRLALYRILCTHQPQTASCFARWGELLWELKAYKKAWQAWEQIKDIKPKQQEHELLMARIYIEHERRKDGIPLLEALVQKTPKHVKAWQLLARAHAAEKHIQKAIKAYNKLLTVTRSLRLRQQSRSELLQLYHKLYSPTMTAQMLRRTYLLAPFEPSVVKMLIAYHLTRRKLIYTLHRRRRRRRRYIRGRWRRRHRLHSYRYRLHHRYYRYMRGRRYRRSYKMVLPKWVKQLLQRSLTGYPKDPEFHLLALRLYKNKPQAWTHLKKLVWLDKSQTEEYIRQLRSLAKKHKKEPKLLALLQKLSERWPYQAPLWGHLGRTALEQGQTTLGCKAYQRAASLAPRELLYRLGQARCDAAHQRWRVAYQRLLKLPHPHTGTLRTEWLNELTRFGLETGIELETLLKTFQRTLARPHLSVMQIISALQRKKDFVLQPKKRKQLSQLVHRAWRLWKHILLKERSPIHRAKALYFLHFGPKDKVTPLFQKALKDSHSLVRGSAIIGLGLRKQKQFFYLVDQMERTDAGYEARAAAKLAGMLMLGRFQLKIYRYVMRWRSLHPWIMLALQHQTSQIPYRGMSMLAQLYIRGHIDQRWKLMEQLDNMTINATIWLGKMRSNRYYRCFAFDGLTHLQRKQAHPSLRQTAMLYRVYQNIFQKNCKYSIYRP